MAIADDLARYRYISTLGSGGMARVDLAEDTLLGRRVALKRMNDAADPQALSRLRREAVTGASLSHPNLVSIYDVITTEDGHLVLVMEYVPGETLRVRITREGKLPVEDALHVLDGVAAGLDAIHARGIVHRDVKPSNILLGADGVVKLADLGIASVPDGSRITTSGSIIGSLSYMAPEQLADTRASPAIDIYALAAVAFETLGGRKARRERNAVALAHALATQPPPDLRAVWPEAPAAAAELLGRGMSRDPGARPRSAGEFAARLKAALLPEATAPMAVSVPRVAVPAPRAAVPTPRARVAPPARARAVPAAAAHRQARSVAFVPADARRRSRTAALMAVLLGLVAVAVALTVVVNSGGRPHQPTASRSAASHRAASTTARKRPGSRPGSPAVTHAASTATSTPTVAAPSAGSAGASASGRPASTATAPVSAVQSFYEFAASHRYAEAWALADPSLRAELLGYDRFVGDQSGDRSITFDAARTVSQSAGGATVAIQTTSVRVDGTHHCTGTVDLVPAGSARWVLHRVNIACT